jgi:hypothetical protein
MALISSFVGKLATNPRFSALKIPTKPSRNINAAKTPYRIRAKVIIKE